jgi:hypothetical protein
MIHNPITIEVRGEKASDFSAELVSALIDARKLPGFVDALLNHHNAYHAICMMEDDALAFEHANRWCGAADGWTIVVGRCTFPEGHLENVPEYVGWGEVQAWLEYGGHVLTVGVEHRTPGEPDILVWDREEFVAGHGADTFVRAVFADDSAMALNHSFRAIDGLEGAFAALPEKPCAAEILAALEAAFNGPPALKEPGQP